MGVLDIKGVVILRKLGVMLCYDGTWGVLDIKGVVILRKLGVMLCYDGTWGVLDIKGVVILRKLGVMLCYDGSGFLACRARGALVLGHPLAHQNASPL